MMPVYVFIYVLLLFSKYIYRNERVYDMFSETEHGHVP